MKKPCPICAAVVKHIDNEIFFMGGTSGPCTHVLVAILKGVRRAYEQARELERDAASQRKSLRRGN